MSAGLRFRDSGELDLGVCQLEKVANAADSSILDIVDFVLGALEEWLVNTDLFSEFGAVKCVSA